MPPSSPGVLPASEETLIIVPDLASIIDGATAWVQKIVPTTLESITARMSSAVVDNNLRFGELCPAILRLAGGISKNRRSNNQFWDARPLRHSSDQRNCFPCLFRTYHCGARVRRRRDGSLIHYGGVHFARYDDTGPYARVAKLDIQVFGEIDDGCLGCTVYHSAKQTWSFTRK